MENDIILKRAIHKICPICRVDMKKVKETKLISFGDIHIPICKKHNIQRETK